MAIAVKGKDEKIVALLHDVIEDSPLELDDLLFLTKNQREALSLLTKKGSSYFDYICKIKKNPISREVKRKDLEHNMNLKRLKRITSKDRKRLEKYRKAYEILSDKIQEV